MEKLQWMFELLDRMSGPASKMDAATRKLDSTLKGAGHGSSGGISMFGQAVQWIGKTFGGDAHAGIMKFAAGAAAAVGIMHTVKPAMNLVGKGIAFAASEGAEAIAALASELVSAGTHLAEFTLDMGIEGGKWVMHSLMFKENTLAAFESMLGTKALAQQVFDKAVKFASVTPFKESQVVAMTQALVTRGFKVDELDTLMKGVGDVGALLGTEKMNSVINALGRMRSQGKMTGETMEMLAEAGINSKLVYGSLEKQLGKTKAEIMGLQAAGKITDAQGVQAVMDAIAQGLSGGTLGGGMEKASRTISGLLSTLAGRPEAIIFSEKANMEGLLEPIKTALRGAINVLDPTGPVAARIIGVLMTIGDAFGRLFGHIDEGAIAAVFSTALDALEPLSKMLAKFLDSFATSFGETFAPFLKSLGEMGKDPEKVQRMIAGMDALGRAAGQFAAHVIEIAVAFAWMTGQAIAFIGDMGKAWDDLVASLGFGDESKFAESGKSLGEAFWEGFVSAINVDPIRIKLDGLFAAGTPQGFGLVEGANAAASGIGQPMTSTPAGTLTPSAEQKAGDRTFHFGDFHFTIEGAGKDGDQVAKDAATDLKARLVAELGNLGFG